MNPYLSCKILPKPFVICFFYFLPAHAGVNPLHFRCVKVRMSSTC